MKLLQFKPTEQSEVQELGGIKENPAWDGRVRDLSLYDTFGNKQADFRTPDANLTPRVCALLGEILKEIERERSGGGPLTIG